MPRTKKSEPKKVVKGKNTVSDLKADVYDIDGKKSGTLSLPALYFQTKVNSRLLAQIVRIHDANKRLGTHFTKTRTEVTGSTRKIYRQKGTGRARHGDIKAPIFAGGGVAHGPKPRDYSLTLPKKMKTIALYSALTGKYADGGCVFISGLDSIQPKTKMIFSMLSKLDLLGKDHKLTKEILLVLPENLKNVVLSARNIFNLNLTTANLLNAYEVMKNQKVIFMKESIDVLGKRNSGKKIEHKTIEDKKTRVKKTPAEKSVVNPKKHE